VSPDFQPSYFVGLGSQVNDVPPFKKSATTAMFGGARNKLVYGAVAATTIYDVDLTANFYSTPDPYWMVFDCASSKSNPYRHLFRSPFARSPAAGTSGTFVSNGASRGRFIYGGSASYTVPRLDFPGAVLLNGDSSTSRPPTHRTSPSLA